MKKVISRVRTAIRPYRKAWAAGITSIIVGLVTDVGLDLSEPYVIAISAAVGSFMTWLIPNDAE